MTETDSRSPEERRREVLRQASVALAGRVITLWDVSEETTVVPVLTSVPNPPYHATILDLDETLRRWGIPVLPGSRWVGCRLEETGRWCVAPLRAEPPAPPPSGVERRSRERITLELAGLCLGLLDQGIQQAEGLLRSVQERIQGTVERFKRFDAVEVVRSCIALERSVVRLRGVGLKLVTSLDAAYLYGDPNALYQILTNLIRTAVETSPPDRGDVDVLLEQAAEELHLKVRDQGPEMVAEQLERGASSVARDAVESVFGGTVRAELAPGKGRVITVTLPLPPQRARRGDRD